MIALFSLLVAAVAAAPDVIGKHLYRGYTVYDPTPLNLSAAIASGWSSPNATCVPGVGRLFFKNGAPSEAHPLGLAFNPKNGDLTGMQLWVTKTVPQPLVSAGWWIADSTSWSGFEASITVGTRSIANSCGSQPATGTNGDRLIVNPSFNTGIKIPLTAMDAAGAGYFNGSYFEYMGYHAFRDIAAKPGQMTWDANTLSPIVPMYDGPTGRINAIFFAVPFVQNGLFSSNGWDPLPLLNALMCKNTCSSACTFANTWIWQTMHIFLRDYTQTGPLHGCTIACC